MENMARCYQRYVVGSALEQQRRVRVLDLGGSDVNGSYRDIFAHPRYAYTAADIAAGPGVHLVLQDPYRLPIEDGSVDIIISGQMLEHCEFFWLTFAEMVRVLAPGGFIFLIAPSAGPEHRYPVDCYRFYPDAYRALARHANCRRHAVWRDERGPWQDLVGVFARHNDLPCAPPLAERTAIDPATIVPGNTDEERVRGQLESLLVLEHLHTALRPTLYCEVGIRFGRSLALAQGPAVGIDPSPELRVNLPASTQVYALTSDDFFRDHAGTALTASIDFAFIDGLHLFEAALRDFMNIERHAAADAVAVIDDVLPNHPLQAARERSTQVWTGDVWRLLPVMRKWRPDLQLTLLDTSPSGLLVVTGLNSVSRVLWENYNTIVREALAMDAPPTAVLERREALPLLDGHYDRLLAELAQGYRAEAMRRFNGATRG